MAKLTKRIIDAAKSHPTREIRLWADSPRGFGWDSVGRAFGQDPRLGQPS